MPSDEIAVIEEANDSNSKGEKKKITLAASNSNWSSRRNTQVVEDEVFGHVDPGEAGPNYRGVCGPLYHDSFGANVGMHT